jgi:opacity protein-like surface antigen
MGVCFVMPTVAQESGFYIQAAIGRAEHATDIMLKDTNTPLLTGQADSRETSWNAALGYRVSSNLAFELGYRHLGEVETTLVDASNATDGQAQFSTTTQGFTLAMLGEFPIGKWTPYIRAGVLFAESELKFSGAVSGTTFGRVVKSDDEGALFGAGVTYDFGDRWSLQADFTHVMDAAEPGKGLNDFHDLSIGVIMKF